MERAVERTVSGGTPTAGAAVVSESLEGLVSAVDELKKSMGLGEEAVDFAAVEQFVFRLRQENEEFRQFAEEAIMSAQRLRSERDELQSKLDQVSLEATMGAALKETQKLKDVADEFERDLYQQKLAEAEARAAEVEQLKERIGELEEENAGLTQTLNEFRQTTHQLQKLQSHEMRRLQKAEKGPGSPARPASTSGAAAVVSAAGAAAVLQQNGVPAAPGSVASGSSSPKAPSSGGAPTPRSARSPRSPAGAAAAGPPAPSAQAVAAGRIAEQLEEVAGGAESGLLAEAAVALRDLAKRDAQLATLQQENVRLRGEVEDLNDTMFSKTFKPPSAWAEREIKYKTEKKYWEEQQKELAARVATLSSEMEGYKGIYKAQELEGRIQDLEARLLQSEREKDNVRSQLHELQLSMRREGEFGNAGKRLSPYRSPLGVAASDGHDVQQMVDNLEQGTSAGASPEVLGTSVAAQRVHGLEVQLQAAASENQELRRKLQEQMQVAVPPSLHAELGQVASVAAVAAAAAGIEARLVQAEGEAVSLRQQLGGGEPSPSAAAAAQGEGSRPVALAAEQQVQQLAVRAQQAEEAGQEEEAAHLRQQAAQLEALAGRLRQAEEEKQALALALAELQPVRLQISAAAEAAAAAGGPEMAAAATEEVVAVPPSLQEELGGATAPAGVVEAKAAEMDVRLVEAEREAGELRQQLQAAVALEQHAAAATGAEREAEARLVAHGVAVLGAGAAAAGAAAAAAGAGAGGAEEDSEEVEQLRQQLAAAQRQKEVAQQQLWQLQGLQEQLQAASAERRRLNTQLAAARPVSLQLAVAAAGQEEGPADVAKPTDVAELRAQLADAERHSAELLGQLAGLHPASSATAEQPVRLALNVSGGEEGEAAQQHQQQQLERAETEVERLRQQLADLQPVRLQLALASPDAPPPARAVGARRSLDEAVLGVAPAEAAVVSPTDLPLLAGEPSDGSMAALLYSSEHANALSAERKAADAALLEYQKATDVPSLLRAKAELETRCEMLEAQIAKMQGDLAHADEANAVFEDHLDSALKTGDVSVLSGLKNQLGTTRASLSKRMFKRHGKAGSPSKDTLKTTVHEMQDQLTSSEEEKNALKRQLAKLSKKYQQVTQQAAHTAGIVAGAQAMQPQHRTSTESSPEASLINGGLDEDGELELMKMREENQMLMEHVVMVKVRQAEMEGEYLEAKRQLLRTREKNLQLARKLQDVREAAEKGDPLPFTPRHSSNGGEVPGAAAVGRALTPLQDSKKGILRIAGL